MNWTPTMAHIRKSKRRAQRNYIRGFRNVYAPVEVTAKLEDLRPTTVDEMLEKSSRTIRGQSMWGKIGDFIEQAIGIMLALAFIAGVLAFAFYLVAQGINVLRFGF